MVAIPVSTNGFNQKFSTKCVAEYINKIDQPTHIFIGLDDRQQHPLIISMSSSLFPPIPPNPYISYLHVLLPSHHTVRRVSQLVLPAFEWCGAILQHIDDLQWPPSPRVHLLAIALQLGVEPHEPLPHLCSKADWSWTDNYTIVCSRVQHIQKKVCRSTPAQPQAPTLFLFPLPECSLNLGGWGAWYRWLV